MKQDLKNHVFSNQFKRVVRRVPYGARVNVIGPYGVAYTEDGKSRVRFWSAKAEVTIPAGRPAT